MFKFIWKNWWRHKERFLLLFIGVLIISAGLSYLVGLSDSSQGTVVDSLQKRWSASYDIVVRPPDSRSVTEDENLLEPNYLSGIDGGISLDQYETIQEIDDIDIAAPISMIGYMTYEVTFEDLDDEDGIYQYNDTTITDRGVEEEKEHHQSYFPNVPFSSQFRVGEVTEDGIVGEEYGLGNIDLNLGTAFKILFAGIDPEEEAALVGLDDAIVDQGSSRFFEKDDTSESETIEYETSDIEYQKTRLPIIASNQVPVDETYIYQIDKLDLPFDSDEEKQNTYDLLEEKGGEDYLDSVEIIDSETFTYTSQDAYEIFLENELDVELRSGESNNPNPVGTDFILWEKPSPISFQSMDSPYPDRWPYAYEAVPFEGDELEEYPHYHNVFRPIDLLGKFFVYEDGPDPPRVDPEWIGFYDPEKLDISQDPLNELPMETYRPASADLVLDQEKQPVNPPPSLKPTFEPFEFLTKPPQMLTTIEGAAEVLGDDPISAIRVKVANVDDLNEESQAILENVADEIEDKTGLITDITLGSSPQPTLTHVPETDDSEELGWFEQPWVKIGSSFTIFEETKIGFSGVVASVIAIAIVYVFASNIVSLLARRQEFAVLLAVGWRPAQLSKLIVYESMILGTFASIIAWAILGVGYFTASSDTNLTRVLLIGMIGLAIYGLGAIIPATMARNIAPYEAMKQGEISQSSRRLRKTRGVLSMSINTLFGKFKRNMLSIIAIALPTSLLSFFIFITFRLEGIMFTTWLGQYTAMEVSTEHYIAMIIALLIAILTTAEIMWQNVSERTPEISILKAVGWRNGTIRRMIITEGILIGVVAGILGLLLAIGIIWGMYQQFPLEHLGFLLATGIVPVFAGLLGSIPPAEKAVRISPAYGVRGQ